MGMKQLHEIAIGALGLGHLASANELIAARDIRDKAPLICINRVLHTPRNLQFVFDFGYVGSMQKVATIPQNSKLADDAPSAAVQGWVPMAHQLDSVCGSEPTPQLMIQLIGCRVDTSAKSLPPHTTIT